jgi:hypothetical protein
MIPAEVSCFEQPTALKKVARANRIPQVTKVQAVLGRCNRMYEFAEAGGKKISDDRFISRLTFLRCNVYRASLKSDVAYGSVVEGPCPISTNCAIDKD